MERSLMKGNEALAEAAIRAGCKCFFGYPITPQTELSAYMAKRMEKSGGVFLQAESEIAAINMVLGAASTGVRAMTSSSSPGVSLKAEGISYRQVPTCRDSSSTYSVAVRDWVPSSRRSLTIIRRPTPWDTVIFIFWCMRHVPSRRWWTP